MLRTLVVHVDGDQQQTDLTGDEPGNEEEAEHRVGDELRELQVLHHLGLSEKDVSEVHEYQDDGSTDANSEEEVSLVELGFLSLPSLRTASRFGFGRLKRGFERTHPMPVTLQR